MVIAVCFSLQRVSFLELLVSEQFHVHINAAAGVLYKQLRHVLLGGDLLWFLLTF